MAGNWRARFGAPYEVPGVRSEASRCTAPVLPGSGMTRDALRVAPLVVVAALAIMTPIRTADADTGIWALETRVVRPEDPPTQVASVSTRDGYSLSIYRSKWNSIRGRLTIPGTKRAPLRRDWRSRVELSTDRGETIVSIADLSFDGETKAGEKGVEVSSDFGVLDWTWIGEPNLRRNDFGLWQMRTSPSLVVRLVLATGSKRYIEFPLTGARDALLPFAGRFTEDYDAVNRRVLARNTGRVAANRAQEGAEARCHTATDDKHSACAAEIRRCILAHDEDRGGIAAAQALAACFASVEP